ncbi:ribosomal RNA-processing protein 1 [Nowakowskiella sp. JEL0078]|nr:ribosomal RNA-processing protein 1 [Nowakowskiella sp. JEL0078]
MERILNGGPVKFIDTFRHFKPNVPGYTYWTVFFNFFRSVFQNRKHHCRLDYFIVSERFLNRVEDTFPRTEAYGASDHCPLVMVLKP